ncbi:T9SS C-terminal target domain-containing protein [candidate division KSB1 bacterium]|nr:MAG: T9SS C-terminal target domain-containing protein [candidate division KSB1 bacterium]
MIGITKYSRRALMLLLLACSARSGMAQEPIILGIGLSGSRVVRDTLVIEGDSLHVVSSYFAGSDWTIHGAGLDRENLNVVRVHFYETSVPVDNPSRSETYTIDMASVVVDTISDPRRIRFRLRLTDVTDPYIASLQLEMGIAARDAGGNEFVSTIRSSFLEVGEVIPILNPVDALHATYVRFSDVRTFPPVFLEPPPGALVPRVFTLRYSQPEPAYYRTLTLTIRNITPGNNEPLHTLWLHDLDAGSNKTLHLNANALFDTTQVDSLVGGNSLTTMAPYRFILSYRDVFRNTANADTLDSVRVDRQTSPPLLFEPQQGSSTTDSTVRVIFQMTEFPDTVWLTFTMDTGSVVRDTFSPHILQLDPSLYGLGIQSFFLDGRDIGSSSPYVAESNRGETDRLVTQCIYGVTLSCGDTIGNETVSVTNENYVWPNDHVTLRPVLEEPVTRANITEYFRVSFRLPETPMPGSVYLFFLAFPDSMDPGSPHRAYIHAMDAGYYSFLLRASQLRYSDMVDSVRGDGSFEEYNRLVGNLRYLIRVNYRDAEGNAEAFSSIADVYYDDRTLPAIIYTPQTGDTLNRSEVLVRYDQPDTALPTTPKLILERTGGENDWQSPHVLYLSNWYAGTGKEIILRPSSLSASTGIDSVSGGDALVSRAVYQLRIEYQDLLMNPASSAAVQDLIYPSGTIVYAAGGNRGTGFIIPSANRELCFSISLRTMSGDALLRGLRLRVNGTVTTSDVVGSQISLWSSADSLFSEAHDLLIDRLTGWNGNDIVFDGFAAPIIGYETYFLVTMAYTTDANPSNRINLLVNGPSSIDCGTDPVMAAQWPLGTPDVALAVTLLSFATEQDTAFGSLRLIWRVASETNNAGFIVYRRAEDEELYQQVASWRLNPELVGRGTAPSATIYLYTDRALQPGKRYYYQLAAQATDLSIQEFDMMVEGIPRLPPSDFILGDAYPNPFNQEVKIPYIVPFTGRVEIVIYDLLGRKVRTLVRALQAPSEYRAVWDSRDDAGFPVPSGVYIYSMHGGGSYEKAKKLLLVR